MMEQKKKVSPPAVGGISLLVVFAVLCLTVFALLSLTTVQADVRLADASVQAVEDYYAADGAAQAVLARLRAGETVPGVTEEDGVYVYTCPISETQELEVEVRIEGTRYTVLRWQAAASQEWISDESLSVWDGELPELE